MIVLLGVIAACLLVQLGAATRPVRAQDTSATVGRDESVFAVAGRLGEDVHGLYLVDYENATICVYQYSPGQRRLRLTAARTYAFDRRLDEYNTEPSPREIRTLVEQHRRLEDAGD